MSDGKSIDDYVNIRVVSNALEMQNQYVSRYFHGTIPGYPFLGEGLRIKGDIDEYHQWRIHRDDVAEMVKRIRGYRERGRD